MVLNLMVVLFDGVIILCKNVNPPNCFPILCICYLHNVSVCVYLKHIVCSTNFYFEKIQNLRFKSPTKSAGKHLVWI